MTKYSAAHDRLQKSILDRLEDNEPGKLKERREDNVLTLNQLRERVIRDLVWLLNCENMETVDDLKKYPEVRKSVLNYGVPAIAGSALSATRLPELEANIHNAIVTFEPRILPQTLRVKALFGKSVSFGRKTVSIEIDGRIWAQPYSLEFLLQTDLDLDTGQVIVNQSSK